MKRITIESLITFMEKVNKEGVPEEILVEVEVRELVHSECLQYVRISVLEKSNPKHSIVFGNAYCPDPLKGTPYLYGSVGQTHVGYTQPIQTPITQQQFSKLMSLGIEFSRQVSQHDYNICADLGLKLEPYSDLEVF